MPIHDWTHVNAGLFHHFHQMWTSTLWNALNSGDLPSGYYALAEQTTGALIPEILALEAPFPIDHQTRASVGLAVADAPPRTRYVSRAEQDLYAAKADRIAIRHFLGHVVAIIEIVSPGNKYSRTALRHFVEKAVGLMEQGIHLLIVDLFAHSNRDPHGIHKAIWDEVLEEPFELPSDKPLILASYSAGVIKAAYVEPIGVGGALASMPSFLQPEVYIPVPLETTYLTTWSACPASLRDAISKSQA
jgi:hypothetical protein